MKFSKKMDAAGNTPEKAVFARSFFANGVAPAQLLQQINADGEIRELTDWQVGYINRAIELDAKLGEINSITDENATEILQEAEVKFLQRRANLDFQNQFTESWTIKSQKSNFPNSRKTER